MILLGSENKDSNRFLHIFLDMERQKPKSE